MPLPEFDACGRPCHHKIASLIDECGEVDVSDRAGARDRRLGN